MRRSAGDRRRAGIDRSRACSGPSWASGAEAVRCAGRRHLLLVLRVCAVIDHPQTQRSRYQYYRCHTNRCTSIPAEAAEERAEEELLRTLGDEDITERVWMRGDSNETELRTALAAFEELSAAAGKMTSRTAKDRLQRQLAALDARIAELESMPAREGRYEYRPTGETYREAWEKNADPDARRDLLKRVGVDIRMGIIDGHLHVHPVALGDRLPLPEWAHVDENSSPEQIQRWQQGAAAERRKWGVPNLE